jgi:hypothetical protein
MLNSKLLELTPEQRQEHLAKARLAKLAKKACAEQNLKLEYADDSYWTSKAAEIGLRLPQRFETGGKGIRKIAKKLNVDIQQFLESTGCTSVGELVKLNPTWNSRALSCLVLEYYLDNMHQK